MFSGKTILITGGTGSFGNDFIKNILKNKLSFKKIIVFSRDEFKQFKLEAKIPKNSQKKFRFLLGDIRDLDRLNFAFKDVDYVVHAAALKHVPKAEYNPFEYIKTNVIGTQNVVTAALNNNVKKVIALSTDKASSPINLYGATKLCADKLVTSANNIKGNRQIKFTVIRYGNVFASRGSVIPKFLELKSNNYFPITDKSMTRFNISLKDAYNLVIWSLNYSYGGEIVVPKIPSYKITDLVKAINPKAKSKIIGIRSGEKIHEEMISYNESRNAIVLKDKYLILSENNKDSAKKYYKKFAGYKKIIKQFKYGSNQEKYISIKNLKNLINEYVDSKND
ncbi:UDP-N-acetylglucosamine 4,6-dehydratase (inverting) [Candidatus Pelagibacter sp.]|uniref:UDP-N-acetylglucosamine 4,6-dehydratase (inverting) n=1 Tax=Candidatus Pelagibacter sp. TaxID=2024849 RepID=UPI003F86792E